MLSLLGISTFGTISIVLLVALAIGLILFFIFVPAPCYFKAMFSGAYISMFKLGAMKSLKINVNVLTEAYIASRKANLAIDVDELQAHYMAGGNVAKLISALTSARNAGLPMSIDTAKAIDLSNADVMEVVKDGINPKVIESSSISGIAGDGIEVLIKARITIKGNVNKFIGGSGEKTIVARVSEKIVAIIGGSSNHKDILSCPDVISKTILLDSLDKGTSYKVLSVEIVSVDVGKNVGATIKVEQAEAEKRIASFKAEEQRAYAQVKEQEMRVKAQAMTAEKIAAEAEVPKAMAQAFLDGKLSVMDYYKMQNLQADTEMRKSISSGGGAGNRGFRGRE